MKFLAKINRGAILTAIVLVGVAVYLVAHGISQGITESRIRQICEDYVQAEVTFSMLPEEFRTEKPDMPVALQAQYLQEMASAMESYYVGNDLIDKFGIGRLRQELESQMGGRGTVYDFQKTIAKFESFKFENGLVTVTMKVNTVFDGPAADGATMSRQKTISETTDIMILQKENGLWKVFYASLVSPLQKNEITSGFPEAYGEY